MPEGGAEGNAGVDEGGRPGAPPPRYGREQVQSALSPLLSDLTEIVDSGVKSGLLQQATYPIQRWTPTDLRVVDGVPTFSNQSAEWETVTDWDSATLAVLNGPARSLLSRDQAAAALDFRVGGFRTATEWFALAAVRELLTDPSRPCPGTDACVDQVVRAAGGEPAIQRGGMMMRGLFVNGSAIELTTPDSRVVLRAPTLEDLTIDVRPFPPPFARIPYDAHQVSAIGEVTRTSQAMDGVREAADELVLTLRLFRLAAVSYSTLEMRFLSPVADHHGTLGTSRVTGSLVGATLTPSDAPGLTTFTSALYARIGGLSSTTLPRGPFEVVRPEMPFDISYQRYTDALTRAQETEDGRFAQSVMGLEALYLPNDRAGELSFRLRVGVAQVMEALGFDGVRVAQDVRVGYGVRSSYVHGSVMSAKDRSAIAEIGGSRALLLRILDYLRLSLALNLLIGIPKDRFLGLLRDSSTSSTGRAKLRDAVEPVAPLMTLARAPQPP